MLFGLAIFSLFTLGMSLLLARRCDKLDKELTKALATTYSTPVKELAANFREFVESVDGKVSPEVDEAIKKLEASDEALPARQGDVLELRGKAKESVDEFIQRFASEGKETNKDARPPLNQEMWKLCCEELEDESYDNGIINAVEHWGKRFKFSMAQQVTAIKQLSYDENKRTLRKYFDQNH